MDYLDFGFIRCACCSPDLHVADCKYNTQKIYEAAVEAKKNGAAIIVFPELSITGYTCGDLFFQTALQKSAEDSLAWLVEKTKEDFDGNNLKNCLIFVGLPVALKRGIFNCAAVILHGELMALVPKTYLPNYGEFYERRQFTPYDENYDETGGLVDFAGFDDVHFGANLILQDADEMDLAIAVELCEDLWTTNPPSVRYALSGATVIANLSAGNEIIGKADFRRNLVKMHSARTFSAYLYAAAGNGESSQDMVFAGHNIIAENGSILAESKLFSGKTIYADIDYKRLAQERRRTTTFSDCVQNEYSISDCEPYFFNKKIRFISCLKKQDSEKLSPNESSSAESLSARFDKKLLRYVDSNPFVPSSTTERSERCLEVITLQAQGLAKRLRHINCQSAVVGLSGGLDSTLALLVTCKAFDLCGISKEKITAITMPCFGTTDRTYNNACCLANECGVTLKEVRISESVLLHMKDIGQDSNVHDVTYENCQARERTQVLMDYANKTNGIVIGTGDLSELALGWCTYNGDHMSMYGVNSSIPKTLVRYLVEWFALDGRDNGRTKFAQVLFDILDTPVSPELLPSEDGKISQKTEDLVGPYELHDFFLYYVLRFGFSPRKIYFLACNSELAKNYDEQTIKKWLKNFYKRFFSQQFKRSCMPDGAKVGSVNLSPRGDWRCPSDAMARIWLEEIEQIE